MSIIRAVRKTQFYVLPTATIEDDRLSWEARGMLVYLLQKPDHWNADVTHLIGRTKHCLGKSAGRDKVYSILKELRMAGYVYRTFRRVGGEFKGVDYEVSEEPDLQAAAEFVASLAEGPDEPFTDSPETADTDTPRTALPETAQPLTAKPGALDKTERATSTDKASKNLTDDPGQAGESPVGFSLSDQEQQALIGCPENYPSNPESPTYLTWATYALAFKNRYQQWPVYNGTMAGMVSKIIARVGDAAPSAARYYVEAVHTGSIVHDLHPIGTLLRHCEGYVAKARAHEKKRVQRLAIEQAVDTAAKAPVPILASRQPSRPKQSSVSDANRSQIAATLGGRLKRKIQGSMQS